MEKTAEQKLKRSITKIEFLKILFLEEVISTLKTERKIEGNKKISLFFKFLS